MNDEVVAAQGELRRMLIQLDRRCRNDSARRSTRYTVATPVRGTGGKRQRRKSKEGNQGPPHHSMLPTPLPRRAAAPSGLYFSAEVRANRLRHPVLLVTSLNDEGHLSRVRSRLPGRVPVRGRGVIAERPAPAGGIAARTVSEVDGGHGACRGSCGDLLEASTEVCAQLPARGVVAAPVGRDDDQEATHQKPRLPMAGHRSIMPPLGSSQVPPGTNLLIGRALPTSGAGHQRQPAPRSGARDVGTGPKVVRPPLTMLQASEWRPSAGSPWSMRWKTAPKSNPGCCASTSMPSARTSPK